MQFWTRIPGISPSKAYMVSSTEYAWEIQNDAPWDTYEHALSFIFRIWCRLIAVIYHSLCTLAHHKAQYGREASQYAGKVLLCWFNSC